MIINHLIRATIFFPPRELWGKSPRQDATVILTHRQLIKGNGEVTVNADHIKFSEQIAH